MELIVESVSCILRAGVVDPFETPELTC